MSDLEPAAAGVRSISAPCDAGPRSGHQAAGLTLGEPGRTGQALPRRRVTNALGHTNQPGPGRRRPADTDADRNPTSGRGAPRLPR